jgi:hypothetical protein
MPLYRNNSFRAGFAAFGVLFFGLFGIRVGLFGAFFSGKNLKMLIEENAVTPGESWMNIYQNNQKIGWSSTVTQKSPTGYRFSELLRMRLNTLGMVQAITMETDAGLHPDFTLSTLNVEVSSGRFRFSAEARVEENAIAVTTDILNQKKTFRIPLERRPFLFSGVLQGAWAAGVAPGDKLVFPVFDPATMDVRDVELTVVGPEDIVIMGEETLSTKVTVDFMGRTLSGWIGEKGEILREEGLLGIVAEKTTREDALEGALAETPGDLTEFAAVDPGTEIPDPHSLKRLVLRIGGINTDTLSLDGGRQRFSENTLTIEKEPLPDPAPAAMETIRKDPAFAPYLAETTFIQSKHPKIQSLSEQILSSKEPPRPLSAVRKLMTWVHGNIEKRPVLSVPDALSTLENRMGDCNEHAALFAALLRASGIPADVEVGVVYMRNRFYYHAWNRVFLGKWVTADALFDQIPADVTHVRMAAGDLRKQADLVGVIGNITIDVVEAVK